MGPHLSIYLTILAIAAWIDLRTYRIPHYIFLIALGLHLVSAGISGVWPKLAMREFALFVGLFLVTLLWRRSFEWVSGAIGMGDIKLIGYLILIKPPSLNGIDLLFSISLISLLVLAIKGREKSHLPFAPIIFASVALPLTAQAII